MAQRPKRDERVVVKLTRDELENWNEAADNEPNCTSRSDFVRLAVTRQIYGAIDQEAIQNATPEVSVDTKTIANTVEEGMEQVTKRLEHLDDRVAEINAEIEIVDHTDQLASNIYDELPKPDSEKSFRRLEGDTSPILTEDSEKPLFKTEDQLITRSTATAWAEFFDVDTADARKALARATTYYPDVKYYRTNDGKRRYFRISGKRGYNDE